MIVEVHIVRVLVPIPPNLLPAFYPRVSAFRPLDFVKSSFVTVTQPPGVVDMKMLVKKPTAYRSAPA
jgi:hypothetical protein